MHTTTAGGGRHPGAAHPLSDVALPLGERLRAAGWWPVTGSTVPVVAGSEVYLATPLARGVRGWQVARVEWPGRPGLPPQEVRRQVHARIAGRAPRFITVFGDAAGVREVWGWRTAPGLRPSLYREEHRGRLLHGLRDEAPEDWQPASQTAASRAGCRAVTGAFISRLHGGPRRASGIGIGVSAGDLTEWIAAEASVDEVRQIWRRLEGFRVLDRAAGSGEWLLGALEGLAGVGAACLDRMEGWIEDLWSGDPGRRRAWGDLRKLIVRRDEMGSGAGRDRLVYEVVLLCCLRGREQDPLLARRARRLLGDRLSAGGSFATTAGMVDVRYRQQAEAEHPRRPRGALAAEVDLLARAETLLRRMRLHGGGGLDEFMEGRREVWRRRRRLRRGLGGENLWIDYPAELAAGGFHLIRGAGRQRS